jgi:hypothetical protein
MFFIDRFFSYYISFFLADPKNPYSSSSSCFPPVKHHFLSLFLLSSLGGTNSQQLGYKIDVDAPQRISLDFGSDFTVVMRNPRRTKEVFEDFVVNACRF